MEVVNAVFSPFDFNEALEMAASNDEALNIVDSLEKYIADVLCKSFNKKFEGCLKKPVSVVVHKTYNEDRSRSLSCLKQAGYNTWYIEIKLTCELGTELQEVHLDGDSFVIEKSPFSTHSNLRIKSKPLKTQVNYELQIFKLEVPPLFFSEIALRQSNLLCDLRQKPVVNDCSSVSFKDSATGDLYFCSCAKTYIEKALNNAKAVVSSYAANSWPHSAITLYQKAAFKDGICHLCIADKLGAGRALLEYGNDIYSYQYPYVCQLMHQYDMDERTAAHFVKSKLKISRWKRESELYLKVKALFPMCNVMREASPSWLGRQRLDIYIPTLQLAIEYQGEQHFRSVEHFGGDAALLATKSRDQLKLDKCNENGVKVIYFNYDEPISDVYIKRKLGKYTKKSS